MERLKEVIGPAPSEMSDEALLARLAEERKRVGEALEGFFKNKGKAKRKRKPAKKRKAKKPSAEQLLLELGMTEEELLAARDELRARKGKEEEKDG